MSNFLAILCIKWKIYVLRFCENSTKDQSGKGKGEKTFEGEWKYVNEGFELRALHVTTCQNHLPPRANNFWICPNVGYPGQNPVGSGFCICYGSLIRWQKHPSTSDNHIKEADAAADVLKDIPPLRTICLKSWRTKHLTHLCECVRSFSRMINMFAKHTSA